MLLGHLALPTILKRYLPLSTRSLYAASLFPDVVDKSLQQLAWVHTGRTWAHTLLGLIISTGAVRLVWGKAAARSWAIGYLGHLMCDADGVVPWLYPFTTHYFRRRYERRPWGVRIKLAVIEASLLEWGLFFWALLLFFRPSRWPVSPEDDRANGLGPRSQ